MKAEAFPPIDVIPYWARLNDELVALVDLVPGDRMDWSPREELWNFRGILLHIASARDYWMGRIVQDGDSVPGVYETARSRDDIKREFGRTWERVERFLANPDRLAATYQEDAEVTGHWIAFHLLEHDVHHRADILHYLALLGIEHPEVGTP